jgi:pimeloyl-ACP methyl ester carboxylesterase
MRLLSWVAPGKAEQVGLDLFSTPRRPREPVEPMAGLAGHRFTIPFDGHELVAWDWGRGPTVLLTHGWSGHSGQMAAFVAPLVRAGFHVLAFDHPGHGQSGGTRANYLTVTQALLTVAHRVAPVHAVVAHSFGCLATIRALTLGLAADRVVLVAPAADSPMYARAFGQAIGLPPARIDGMIERIRVAVGGTLDALDPRHLAQGLEVPALVVHDRQDADVPFAHGEAIAAAWPGARLEAVSGLGHHRLLRDPGVVETAVRFLRAPRRELELRAGAGEVSPALSLVR